MRHRFTVWLDEIDGHGRVFSVSDGIDMLLRTSADRFIGVLVRHDGLESVMHFFPPTEEDAK